MSKKAAMKLEDALQALQFYVDYTESLTEIISDLRDGVYDSAGEAADVLEALQVWLRARNINRNPADRVFIPWEAPQ